MVYTKEVPMGRMAVFKSVQERDRALSVAKSVDKDAYATTVQNIDEQVGHVRGVNNGDPAIAFIADALIRHFVVMKVKIIRIESR